MTDKIGMDAPRLDHEQLDVYRCAIDFLRVALPILRSTPRSETIVRDQLKRAAISIPLNIAEGTGKPSTPDRSRYYAIARGSAMECAALLDVCALLSPALAERHGEAKSLLVRIVAMLTRMCR